MKDVGVIGGGVIGLFSAYYLNRAGHRVTIIDQGDLTNGCSWGNAGMIVPSHIIPLAAPGMVAKGIRWMFNPQSPFYLKPRFSCELLKWGYHFYRNSTWEHVNQAIPVLKEISLISKNEYRALSTEPAFDFGFRERGLLMLYRTAAAEKEEVETAQMANHYGIEARILDPAEIQSLEPDVEVRAKGGIYFPGDAHLVPQELLSRLMDFLKNNGVSFVTSALVTDFEIRNREVKSMVAGNARYSFDELILAAGSWSGQLASRLGISLPMEPGKGYSFTTDIKSNIRIPTLFVEERVAATPMGSSIRFGGTMELAGMDHRISMNRVSAIVNAIPHYYPSMKISMPEERKIWHGMRPCSPDGLPYIGRLSHVRNVIVATGHAMMGVSLGPATGKIVSGIVDDEKAIMDMDAFSPERFD